MTNKRRAGQQKVFGINAIIGIQNKTTITMNCFVPLQRFYVLRALTLLQKHFFKKKQGQMFVIQ